MYTVAAKDLSDEKVRLLSRQMSHRVDTHRKCYEKLDTVAGTAKAHKTVKSLTKPKTKTPEKQTRRALKES